MSINNKPSPIPVAQLHFDHRNPRLMEFGITDKTPESEIMDVLWDAMDVRELVQSIAASGFFQNEPLIVSEEHGKNIVIEGNRRLAAVKAILDPAKAKEKGWEIPTLRKKEREALEQVPVIVAGREDAWRYLGFKHVNGPAKWGSYAKANYIADVHRTYKIPLADIAEQIGDRHKTVQRLYRGLMVIEQAEREKVYNRADRYRTRFAFSHLYTGLDYDGIRGFLGLTDTDPESERPVPKSKLKNLGELCVWLYGGKPDTPPVVAMQNPHLRQLNEVLGSREATSALRAGGSLAQAVEISRPAGDVFEEALLAAKRHLTQARAYLTTGFHDSEDLLRTAGSIANLADDLYREMERKLSPKPTERLTKD